MHHLTCWAIQFSYSCQASVLPTMPVRPNPAINRATSGDASSVRARPKVHLHNIFLMVSFDCIIIHLGSALCKKTGDELCILDQSNWHAHIAVRNSSETNPKHVQLGFDIFGLWTLAVDLLLSLCQANPLLEWSPMMGWSTDPFVSTHTRDDFIITSVNYSYPRATYLVCVSKKAAPPGVWWQGQLSFAWLQYILGYEVCLLTVLYPFVVAWWSHWSFALLGEDGARPNSEFIVFSLCVLC